MSPFGPHLSRPRPAHRAIAQSIPDPAARERLLLWLNPELCEPGGVESAIAYDWTIVLRGPAAAPMEAPA